MNRNASTIDALNMLWTVKRALIDQYVARSKVRAARGDDDLAQRFSDFAFEQMREVSALLDRIVELDGIPELRPVQPVPVGETVPQQVEHSKEAELAVLPLLESAENACSQAGDGETASLLASASERGRERLSWLEMHALSDAGPSSSGEIARSEAQG